jgi:hypothetical protein
MRLLSRNGLEERPKNGCVSQPRRTLKTNQKCENNGVETQCPTATSVEIRLDKIGYAAKAQLNVRTEDPVGLRPGRINN